MPQLSAHSMNEALVPGVLQPTCFAVYHMMPKGVCGQLFIAYNADEPATCSALFVHMETKTWHVHATGPKHISLRVHIQAATENSRKRPIQPGRFMTSRRS